MKLIDKMANGIEVLAPIIILFFACAAYWRYTENENLNLKNLEEKYDRKSKKIKPEMFQTLFYRSGINDKQ